MVTSIHYNMLNECMNAKKSVTNPVIGMVATMFVGSDRYAMVVTEVYNKNKIKVAHMSDSDYKSYQNSTNKYTLKNGADVINFNNLNDYIIINEDRTDFETAGKIYTYRKNKRWMPSGDGMWGTCSIHLGKAETYLDPCF